MIKIRYSEIKCCILFSYITNTYCVAYFIQKRLEKSVQTEHCGLQNKTLTCILCILKCVTNECGWGWGLNGLYSIQLKVFTSLCVSELHLSLMNQTDASEFKETIYS